MFLRLTFEYFLNSYSDYFVIYTFLSVLLHGFYGANSYLSKIIYDDLSLCSYFLTYMSSFESLDIVYRTMKPSSVLVLYR